VSIAVPVCNEGCVCRCCSEGVSVGVPVCSEGRVYRCCSEVCLCSIG